ncbi:double-strand break repair helicase AddA [uncultured Nitratireductor sp.]|uniref:double-strand break repair helicase AddA n=1 Tax=uncultured Nitratireductor sp. TaxID=520953 RepID=UPI00261DA5C6|nr:double-strand break repair helicase AddA [uncultured Nitratireductor sp.]
MKKLPFIPEDTIRAQALAADPANSAWVSANAGSGKTHVLAQRVIRLLLQGADPSKILCLTYTRAAAANMANRVFRDLAGWSLMSDDALSEVIAKLEGGRPGRETLARARRLFARALETPGGLKIQTIHAFCEAILHQFPLEANIAGHFELLDSQMEEALLAEARRDLLSGAAGEDAVLSDAFAEVLERGGESGLQDLLSEIVSRRDGLRAFIDEIANDPVPYSALFEEFGFAPGENAEAIAASIWPLPGFDASAFRALVAEAEAVDAKTVLKGIVPEATLAFEERDPLRRLEHLRKGFLKADGGVYGESTFKKALRAALPDIVERYVEAAEVIRNAVDRVALFRMLEATRSALVIADGMIARYERLKRARGFLDFNDLITRTIRLLARADAGPWVQYKLDKGIDHVLIDEAQDTSPEQWQIVRLLAEEFFAGESAREGLQRTIFAVGDEKQSIYSFQGAEPAAFGESGRAFEKKVRAAERRFERLRLRYSFRSTEDVLKAADLVFSREEAAQGLTHDPEPIEHLAVRAGQPGYVEVWSPIAPEVVEEPDDWTEAIDHASAPAVRLAETIAQTVEDWIRNGEIIEGTGKRLTAGDVLVLVRKRDRFVHALSRSLKNRHIDVAGADRLRLTAHIAVQDLIALGRFLLQPHDDLSLAAVLKSPLFGMDEERLFRLAWNRGRAVPLFDAMRAQALSDPAVAGMVDTLQRWQNEAAFKPAFEFYAGLLSGSRDREGARRLFVARLGHEANDILDEFLSFALAGERAGLNGLEALLSALDGQAPEIKREMDQTRDELRIMTVHAAKGLEAPVVFLVDPGSAPFVAQHLPKLMPFAPRGEGWQGKGFLWRAGKDVSNSVAAGFEANAKVKAEEEYRRLLYVGMTRAEDRLIVCGYHGAREPQDLTWQNTVRQALSGAEVAVELDRPAACAPVYRYRVSEAPPVEEEAAPVAEAAPETALPETLLTPPPMPTDLPRPLSPSRAGALIEADYEPVPSQRSPVLDGERKPGFAIQRGIAVHRLLQLLPDCREDAREAAAQRYLDRVGCGWTAQERESVWRSVQAILEDARFSAIFASGSRAEISVMGELTLGERRHAVSGKIDRLAVTDEAVLIVDYKTNRPTPETLAEAPGAYVAQLALYAELLKPLYPGRRIEAALLFTEAPILLPVPEEELAAALERLAPA